MALNLNAYPESDKCYLDGRYFNAVLSDYEGLCTNPIIFELDELPTENEPEGKYHISMETSKLKLAYPSLIRVILISKTTRHSMLIIMNHHDKHIYLYDPNSLGQPEVNNFVALHLKRYIRSDYPYEFSQIVFSSPPVMDQPGCKKFGFCNALVLNLAVNLVRGLDFTEKDIKNVKRFMSYVIMNYPLPSGDQEDIEFEMSHKNAAIGGVIGGVAGAGLGYLLGFGLAGAAIAGVVGLIGGAYLGNRRDQKNKDSPTKKEEPKNDSNQNEKKSETQKTTDL